MNLSEKINSVGTSQTLAISQKAAEMKAAGIDVISFSAGEPDFDTPRPIIDAAKKALDAGFTRYAPVAGLPILKNAIIKKISTNLGVSYTANEVIATCGAKSAIFIALQVLLNPGDEVIVPAPYWVSYPDQVKLAGGKPVTVMTSAENNFKLTVTELEKAITEKTKVVLINSPSNPVGCVYSKGELEPLVKLCAAKNIMIIADEIYDQLVFDGKFCSVLNSSEDAKNITIYINGVSKSHAMTGWRMGYAAGPAKIIAAMTKYQSQLLTSIPTFVQIASVTALEAPKSMIEGMINSFKKRRDLIVALIKDIPSLSCIYPEGAFYAFVNIEKTFGKEINGTTIDSSVSLAESLLSSAHVAVVPGSAFGAEGYIRLSFATSEEKIKAGMARIAKALN